MKKFANDDAEFAIKEEETITATLLKTSPASVNTFSNGKGVLVKEVLITISGATDGICTQSAPLSIKIPASSQYNYDDDEPLCLEGDEGDSYEIAGIDGASAPCALSVTPYIKTAGQDKDFEI